MTILNTIIDSKRTEVQERKELVPVKKLESSNFFKSQPVSLVEYLNRTDRIGVIAEIKRKSPSKGVLHQNVSVEELSIGYMQAGASALSVLTDGPFFGGSLDDLRTARKFNFCPILQKDFMIDEYQIIEAKSAGADVILLLASVLTPEQIQRFAVLAHELKMEVLLEVHNPIELESCFNENIDVVGVNNRNLSDFTVNIETSLEMASLMPENTTCISESGIASAKDIVTLTQAGYSGFLIGETFMKTSQPMNTCRNLIKQVTLLSKGKGSTG